MPSPTNHQPLSRRAGETDAEVAIRTFWQAASRLRRLGEARYARSGLSIAQWRVLRSLHEQAELGNHSVRATDLCIELLLNKATVSGLLARLLRMGLVSSAQSEADQRARAVKLTRTGRKLVISILLDHPDWMQELMAGLPRAEQRLLTKTLEKLCLWLDPLVEKTGGDPGRPPARTPPFLRPQTDGSPESYRSPKGSRMRRVLIFILIVVVLAGTAYGGWRWYAGHASAAPQFRTAEAKIGDVVFSISATGTIVPEDTIDVGAQVNGQIASFGNGVDGKPIDYRSEVAEGSLLATIDEALYAADVATAQAQLAQAEAQVRLGEASRQQETARLTQAEQDWARAQKLGVSEALAEADYDALKSAREQAVAAVAVAEAQIGQAKAQIAIAAANLTRAQRNLAYCVITSPVSGVIIDKRVDVGQTVVASLNAPSLFLIAKDLRKMLLLVQVNEADISRVQPGNPVNFTVDAVPGRTFPATVRKVRLNAAITQNVVTYTVEIATDNPDLTLLPYLTANVTFIVGQRDDVLTVPNAALRFTPSGVAIGAGAGGGRGRGPKGERGDSSGPGSKVWILDAAGQPKAVRVKASLSDGSVTEVQSDELSEGAQVIVGQLNATARPSGGDATNPFAPQPFRRR